MMCAIVQAVMDTRLGVCKALMHLYVAGQQQNEQAKANNTACVLLYVQEVSLTSRKSCFTTACNTPISAFSDVSCR
jgi:hypothetical protein